MWIFSMHSMSEHSQKKSASARIDSKALLMSSTRSFTRRNSASLRAARSASFRLLIRWVRSGFSDHVVALDHPHNLLTLAFGMSGDHDVLLGLACDALPVLDPQLDSPVAELVGALAQERNPSRLR